MKRTINIVLLLIILVVVVIALVLHNTDQAEEPTKRDFEIEESVNGLNIRKNEHENS